MLNTYRLDNPETDETLVLDRGSYVWGALGGPLYLLAKGLYALAIVMLLVMLVIAGGAVVGLTVSVYLFDASMTGLIVMLAIVTGALVVNGMVAVGLARYGYRRRGWHEHRS